MFKLLIGLIVVIVILSLTLILYLIYIAERIFVFYDAKQGSYKYIDKILLISFLAFFFISFLIALVFIDANLIGIIIASFFFLISIILTFKSIKVIPVKNVVISELFGKYLEPIPNGWYFKCFFIKYYGPIYTGEIVKKYTIGRDIEEYDLAEPVVFRDSASIVTFLLSYSINDPVKYIYEIKDPHWVFVTAIVSNIRATMAELDIEDAIKLKKTFNEKNILRDYDLRRIRNSWGIHLIDLKIENIVIPKGVLDSKHNILISINDSKIVEIRANAEKAKLISEGQGVAKAREYMINVVKNYNNLELLYTLRELAKGTSNTILYQLPDIFKNDSSLSRVYNEVMQMIKKGSTQYEIMQFINSFLKKQ